MNPRDAICAQDIDGGDYEPQTEDCMELTDYSPAPSTVATPVYDGLAEAFREQQELADTAIDRQVADQEKLIAQARSFAPEIEVAKAFVAAFPPTEPGYIQQMRTSVGVGSGSLNGVLIMWDARRLQDVTPRLSWLAQKLGKYLIEDYPELGRRTYDFGRLKFCVFFNTYDAKTVCKFVEVGKEEKPIYKLMCGEQEVM